MKKILYGRLLMIITLLALFGCSPHQVGDKIDEWNSVAVYYNGDMGNSAGRNTANGYNLGLKWQCVEFVKRYYLQHLGHKFPDTYGHARDMFNPGLKDGALNAQRGLVQYKNGGSARPRADDLVVFAGTFFNEYGHVAIVTTVGEESFEVVQQNTGTRTRQEFDYEKTETGWETNGRILGWLRLPE